MMSEGAEGPESRRRDGASRTGRRWRWLRWFLGGLCVATVVGGWGYWEFGPGLTVEQTARILVLDTNFGFRARAKAIRYGNAILPALVRQSAGFDKLTARNSLWIADVLGGIRTKQSLHILADLYYKGGELQHLVGAVGLAEQGQLQESIAGDRALINAIESGRDSGRALLGIIALGSSRSASALPVLWRTLQRCPNEYTLEAYASVALARIGSRSSVAALKKMHCGPHAFMPFPRRFALWSHWVMQPQSHSRSLGLIGS